MSASAWFREPRPQGARAQAVRQKPDAQAATVVPLTQREKGNLARETVAREGPVSGALESQGQSDALWRKEGLGSGAVEATCAQYQCQCKRTGQFRSPARGEALLCLDTFWRNER